MVRADHTVIAGGEARRFNPLVARRFFRDPVGYVARHGGGAAVMPLPALPGRFLLVRDPAEIWNVLVGDADSFRPGKWKRRTRRYLGDALNTLDGDEHRRRRQLIQATFPARRMATFSSSIVGRVERMQADWRHGARIRVRDAIDPLAIAAAGEALFSTDLDPRGPRLAGDLATVMKAMPGAIPPLRGTARARALRRVDDAVSAIVAQRARSEGPDDLVGGLCASGLSQRTVRGELAFLLLASVEEPPSTLEAAWYLLACHPAAEERLHAEIDGVLGDRAPTGDDSGRLPYLDAVVRETLRLLPPARHIDRCPIADVTIAGARVRAGSNLLVSPLVTHRDPALYDRPSAFVPERWLGPGGAELPRGSYLPFGAGPHACLGRPLALSIVGLTLATIGRRWRLRVDPDAPLPSALAGRLTVTLQRR
jgi:cytochrome P450